MLKVIGMSILPLLLFIIYRLLFVVGKARNLPAADINGTVAFYFSFFFGLYLLLAMRSVDCLM